MNLGTKREESSLAPAQSPDMPDVTYPSIRLEGDKAKEFCEQYKVDKDETCTAKVKLKLTGFSSDRYGHSVTLDVISIDDVNTSDAHDEGESGEEHDEGDYGNPAIARLMKSKKS